MGVKYNNNHENYEKNQAAPHSPIGLLELVFGGFFYISCLAFGFYNVASVSQKLAKDVHNQYYLDKGLLFNKFRVVILKLKKKQQN